jgi:hypothetical protein
MSKLITYIILLTALISISVRETYAQDNAYDFRVEALESYLEAKKSPLAMYADEFVDYADKYGLDYRLVPAITGVESTFGKRIPVGSYNAYGWANGEYRFSSWEDSIGHVSMTLKTKYIDKGAVSIERIGKRYAPPSNTWSNKVRYFMGEIDTMPVTFDLSS